MTQDFRILFSSIYCRVGNSTVAQEDKDWVLLVWRFGFYSIKYRQVPSDKAGFSDCFVESRLSELDFRILWSYALNYH